MNISEFLRQAPGLKRGSAYFFLPPLAGAPFPAAAAWPGFGRLAPYFERLCKRPLTPAVSKAPRIMW